VSDDRERRKRVAMLRERQKYMSSHQSPFTDLEVPISANLLSSKEIQARVMDFFCGGFTGKVGSIMVPRVRKEYPQLSTEYIVRLLSDVQEYARLAGAFFAILKRVTSTEDHIGRLLLRNDYRDIRVHYCAALAEFNSPVGVEYLKKYLSYYLTRPDLCFAQCEAIGALAYLDRINGTAHIKTFKPAWRVWAKQSQSKPYLKKVLRVFASEMNALQKIRIDVESGAGAVGAAAESAGGVSSIE